MRSVLLALVLVVPGLMRTCSCGSSSSNAPAAPGQMEARLAAATGIADTNERDKALQKLCTDAGGLGDATMVNKALDKISETAVFDGAASAGALRLAKAGKATDSTAVAKRIRDTTTRDAVLAKIAKGETD